MESCKLVERRTALVVICVGLLGGCADKSDHNASQEPTSLALTADPLVVATGERATLSWTASNAATCEASGGWSGTQADGRNVRYTVAERADHVCAEL